MVEPSSSGNPAALEEDSEAVDIQRLLPLDQWDLDLSEDHHLVGLVASEVVDSVVDLMAEEVEEASEEDSKNVEATAVVVVELDTKAAEVSLDQAVEERVVVGMEAQTGTALPQMLQLVQEAELPAVAVTEEDMVVPDPLIATDLQHHLVGMTHVVVAAHMKTETVVIVEAEDTTTVTLFVGVAAIWSR